MSAATNLALAAWRATPLFAFLPFRLLRAGGRGYYPRADKTAGAQAPAIRRLSRQRRPQIKLI
jgi:hypothetical protein